MPQAFDNRFVAIVKESTYGTNPGSGYSFGEADDESIRHQFDLLTREDMSRYGSAQSVAGKEVSEGDVNLALMNDHFMGNVLLGIMGKDTVGSISGGLYPHTFTEQENASSLDTPSFTLIVGREEHEHYYSGAVVNSLSVSANLNEYASVGVNFMAKSEGSTQAIGTLNPTFPDDKVALYFANAKVFFNADSTASDAVKSISFDINLNRDGDNACGLGSTTYVRAPPAQRREISGTIEFNRYLTAAVESEPLYTQMVATDGLQLNPDSAATDTAIKVQFGDDSTADLLTFNFYKIRFEAPESNVSGRDSQTVSVGFVALFDNDGSNPADKMMDIVMRNDKSAAF